MSITSGYRLLAEGSETLIGHLPNNVPSLNEGNEIVYGPAGGPSVAYVIEKIRYVVEYEVVGNEEAPDAYSVYGMTDLIVSEV